MSPPPDPITQNQTCKCFSPKVAQKLQSNVNALIGANCGITQRSLCASPAFLSYHMSALPKHFRYSSDSVNLQRT